MGITQSSAASEARLKNMESRLASKMRSGQQTLNSIHEKIDELIHRISDLESINRASETKITSLQLQNAKLRNKLKRIDAIA